MIMNNIFQRSFTKIGIFGLFLMMTLYGCRRTEPSGPGGLFRFDEWLTTWPARGCGDSLKNRYPELVPFFSVYNNQVIGIGPDTMPGYPGQLLEFLQDPSVSETNRMIGTNQSHFQNILKETVRSLSRIRKVLPDADVPAVVTFVGGFNQTFVTLPGILGVGLEHYLGDTCSLYTRLGMPGYLLTQTNPENLPVNAVRAWISSEMPEPTPGSTFLDHLVHEGILYYLSERVMKGKVKGNLFHQTEKQSDWCRENEKAMWKFLVQREILFSTDRFTIRRFFDEAPFTRDYGQDSPGQTGKWIGYRLVASYVKKNRCRPAELLRETDSRKILSLAGYHP